MSLIQTLLRRIAATGPMTLADYMAECLMHPEHGYYATRDPLGAGGDFTTAPEISQMFGELTGLALAQSWLDAGAPPRVTLAELGPGRGTLMADILRATRNVPGFASAVRPHLVERSPVLRAEQASRVPHATWHDSVGALPDGPLLLVANEFLDALPIRQFTREAGGWSETMVTRAVGAPTGGADPEDRLAFARAPAAPIAALDHRLGDTAPGDVVEVCPALPEVVAAVAERLRQAPGLALFIDYGGWRSRGDTLQAVRAHAFADPLEGPGTVDLTAHVDFEAVARAARGAGAEAWGPEGQGAWLGSLGIAQRAEALARGMPDGTALEHHVAAFRRLTAADEMGTVFKVMALTPLDAPPPAGIATPAPATGAGHEGTAPDRTE